MRSGPVIFLLPALGDVVLVGLHESNTEQVGYVLLGWLGVILLKALTNVLESIALSAPSRTICSPARFYVTRGAA
jgi:hypothetical protein